MNFNSSQELIQDIKNGKMVILCDDEDRENEGDLIIAAEKITADAVNFMAHEACGLICLSLTPEKCAELELELMVEDNDSPLGTNFTVSIDAKEGISTGISAIDRAHTIRTAVAVDAKPQDLSRPGHIFPVMAHPQGLRARHGHTEASCVLAKLAGLRQAAVMVEIMNPNGTMARLADLHKFAAKHELKIGSIRELISSII